MSTESNILVENEKDREAVKEIHKAQHQKWIQQFDAQKVLHFMILPSLLVVLLFQYFPIQGLIISFKNYSVFQGIWGSPWARNSGFEHFLDFFKNPAVLRVVRNTLALAFFSLAIVTPLPVIFAILLNEIQNRPFKKVTQTITYIPHFISWVVIGGIMFLMFLPTRTSPVNRILLGLNIVTKPTDIMNHANTIWVVFICAEIWKHLGWSSIIYLAVIASIDPNLYEAVEIDGGGRLAKILHVTLPSLKPTFMILFILKCGQILSAAGFFDQSYILGTPANKSMSQVLDVYILRIGLEQARYSFAAAVGFLKGIMNLMLLLSANYLSKRITGKGLF